MSEAPMRDDAPEMSDEPEAELPAPEKPEHEAPPEKAESAAPSDPHSTWYFFAAFLVVVLVFAVQIAFSPYLPLNDSEALRYVAALSPQVAYPDQAPGGAYLTALGMAMMGDEALGVRVVGLLAQALLAFTLYFVGTAWANRRAGFLAALLFSLTPFAAFGGLFSLREMAAGACWLWGALAVQEAASRERPAWLTAVGVAAGAGLLFSASALAFWPLAIAYLVFNRRHLLRSGWFPLGLLLTLLCWAPQLLYDIGHHFPLLGAVAEAASVPSISPERTRGLLLWAVLALSPGLFVGFLLALGLSVLRPHQVGRVAFWFSAPYLVLASMFLIAKSGQPLRVVVPGLLLLYPLLAAWLAERSDEAAPSWMRICLLGPFALWLQPSVRRLLTAWMVVPALLVTLGMGGYVLVNGPWYLPVPERHARTQTVEAVVTALARLRTPASVVVAERAGLCAQLVYAFRHSPWPLRCETGETDLFNEHRQEAIFGRAVWWVREGAAGGEPSDRLACTHAWRLAEQEDDFRLWACDNVVSAVKSKVREAAAPTPLNVVPSAAGSSAGMDL